MPSTLRPTTIRIYTHLVTRCHFRSRDKYGGHTIRCAVAENPMLHANFMALCFTELELLLIAVLHYGNWDFRHFLLLWDWPWPDDLYIGTLAVFPRDISDRQIWTYYVKVFESYRLTYQHTYRYMPKSYTTPLRGWSDIDRTTSGVTRGGGDGVLPRPVKPSRGLHPNEKFFLWANLQRIVEKWRRTATKVAGWHPPGGDIQVKSIKVTIVMNKKKKKRSSAVFQGK